MIFHLLLAAPLFTYGTALMEAGALDRGESALHSLLSTSISSQLRNRIYYNLGVAALHRSAWDEALSNFQNIENAGDDLKPFVNQGVQIALKHKVAATPPPFSPFPIEISLTDATVEVENILKHVTALPFEGADTTHEYPILEHRLQTLLKRKNEWWSSVIQKQQEMAPKGCFQQHWEGMVQALSEGTSLLEKAETAFNKGEKPYAVLYPLLQDAIDRLQMVESGLATEEINGGNAPEQTERFQTLSEMFRKDANPTPPIPKGALW